MRNIGVLIGTGYYGEDVLHKIPWIRHLDSNNRVYTISRIDPDVNYNKNLNNLMGHEI